MCWNCHKMLSSFQMAPFVSRFAVDQMEIENSPNVNLYDFPLIALRGPTRQIIVNNLNKTAVLTSPEGLPRDWRGLAHLSGLPLHTGNNPTSQLLSDWETQTTSSLGLLNQYLGELDRWDVVDDIQDLISEDAKAFMDSNSETLQEFSGTECRNDTEVLTFDDTVRLNHGMPPQLYDALLLYADKDSHFARQMLEKLENDYGLKLCLKESLVGGLPFEHHGVLQLISERCRRVIVIVSSNFLNSPVNRFFVLFSQSLSIEKGRRIIIPCMYEREKIELPVELKSMFKLDYYRATLRHYDFWQKLHDSIIQPSLQVSLRRPTVMIQEIANTDEKQIVHDRYLKPVDEYVKEAEEGTHELAFHEPLKPQYLSDQEVVRPEVQSSDLRSTTCIHTVTDALNSTTSLSSSKKKQKSKSPAQMLKNLLRIGSNSNKQSMENKKIALKA